MSLEKQKQFWKTLFEEKKLASQLASLAADNADRGVTYDFPQYGKVHVVTQAASALGDNFMSDTFIMTATMTLSDALKDTTTYSTFIKVMPSNAVLRQAACESHLHDREINMYRQFFDLLHDIRGSNSSITLDVPDVYHVHLEDIVENETDGSGTCILIENLKSQGYSMADKMGGADYRHCRLALTSLAHYHALTLTALRKWADPLTGECTNLPPSVEFILEKTLYDTSTSQMIKNWSSCLIEFAKDVERPDLAEWLAELIEHLDEIAIIDTIKSAGSMACVLHGDFWNNNMMFKYENVSDGANNNKSTAVPVSLKLIDFQVSRIGHPMTDVLFFLYASAMPETREKHMIELLRHYFDTLTTNLKVLGTPLSEYTWEDFLADYKKRSPMWLFLGSLLMSMTLNKETVTNLQDMEQDEGLKEQKTTTDAKTKEKTGENAGTDLENTLNNMMKSQKLSKSAMLTDRLLRLIIEVKALNSSVRKLN